MNEHGQTFDAELRSHVHPSDWTNPEPAERYNIVVLGAGTAGLVTAAGAAALGARVALVERGHLGGDCLNVGCVPSKALLRSARAVADVRDAGRFGIRVPDGVEVDFAAVMERVHRVRAEIAPHDSAERFREMGVDVFFGQARFAGRDEIRVGDVSLKFSRACIATGSSPSLPPIEGLEATEPLTNETVFSLQRLPRRLVVVGAGPIGCELAQAFARFGSQVTLLDQAPRILPAEEADASHRVHRALERDGVTIATSRQVLGVQRDGDERVVYIEGDRGRQELRADHLLVATGRVPNVASLDLEAAGVAYDPRTGIEVDDKLRTTNHDIYAAGDVCSRYKFTHVADAMARVVVQNALYLPTARSSAPVVPWCTYTDPELAHVGLYPREAAEQGIETETYEVEFSEVDRAITDGDRDGVLKVLVEAGTDEMLGATLVARNAGDLICELTLAMQAGVGLKTIAETVHPYPTHAEVIRHAADAFNRSRLTPMIEKLSHKWLEWHR